MINRLVINNLKHVEGNGRDLTWTTILTFSRIDCESPRKTSVRIVVLDVRFEIGASSTQVTNANRSPVAFGSNNANAGVACSRPSSGTDSIPEAFRCSRQCLLPFGSNCGSLSIWKLFSFLRRKRNLCSHFASYHLLALAHKQQFRTHYVLC
jgi:hypothetical protein